jgi:IS4 transposase
MEATGGRGWTAEDGGMDAAEHIVSVKREGWKAVIRIKDMDRDVFGDGLPIGRSLAQEPFVPATLRTHGGAREIQLRWRPGVVKWCDKPHSKEAKGETARVLVVESRFDGKSIWLYAVCPDEALEDPGGIARRAAQAYHDRWQIETSFQTVKQEFGLEKARVRTFKRLENLFALCILAYVFATDHLRRTPGFRKALKLLSDNLETVSTKTHVLLAGIRALVGLPKVRFISGRPRKAHPPDPLQLLLAF